MERLSKKIVRGTIILALFLSLLFTFIIRAGDPLVDLNSENPSERASAAMALGRDKVFSSMGLLVMALKDRYASVRERAVFALGELRDPKTAPYLTLMLKDKNKNVRIRTAEALGKMGVRDAILPLKENLTDWHSNSMVVEALTKLGWKPQSDSEKVHFLVATRKEASLINKWSLTKNVLLQDVDSGRYNDIENALKAFIAMDVKDIFPVLINKLDIDGNEMLATAYINSGHPRLNSAARKWEAKTGHEISFISNDSVFGNKSIEKSVSALTL